MRKLIYVLVHYIFEFEYVHSIFEDLQAAMDHLKSLERNNFVDCNKDFHQIQVWDLNLKPRRRGEQAQWLGPRAVGYPNIGFGGPEQCFYGFFKDQEAFAFDDIKEYHKRREFNKTLRSHKPIKTVEK